MSGPQTNQSVILISGPCGVGKSTLSRAIAKGMMKSARIEGDVIHDMLTGNEQLSWEDQLALVWTNLLSLTTNFLQNNLNVIIDYVVEDELEWFSEQLSKFNVTLYYVVLRADKARLVERLTARGNENLIERSFVLLNQLENNDLNKPYLYDTTDQQPDEVLTYLKNHMAQFKFT